MKLVLLGLLGPWFVGMAAAVHTTGVNWDGVFAISASVCTIIAIALVPLGRLFLRALKEGQREAVLSVIQEEVVPRLDDIDKRVRMLEEKAHDNDVRLSRLEGIREGQASAMVMHVATEAARATQEEP